MKKSIILSFAAAILLSLSINVSSAQVKYASNNYTSTSTFNSDVKVLVQEMENMGFSIVDYDITTLSRYQKFNWDLTCYGGREYVVFGYTEAGIIDLGLYIYDSNGKYVTANPTKMNNGITATKFNAYYKTEAQIVAKNEKSKKALKNYKVAIIVGYRYR